MPISKEEIEQKLVLDHSRDSLLTFFGKKTLQDRYCQEGETPQHVFGRASLAFCGGDLALAQRLYDYASKLWLSFATPLIANGGAANNGLPISCFLNYVADSIPGLVANFEENAHLSTKGGGIGTFWGAVRSVGEKNGEGVETPGLMPFLHVVDSQVLAYHQGTTRRGSAATYIRCDHPEIVAFVEMRQPTGGDVHRKNLNLHHGVCLTDKFMFAVKADLMWDLVSPKTGEKKGEIKARELWQRILTQRVKTGEPYLFFEDTANRALPLSQKLKGLYINHSNLCTEIMLATAPDRTAVCCLSSINVAKRREWRPVVKQFLLDIATMLDNVLDIFIRDAPKEMWRAVKSAIAERAIGIGTLGLHTYFQQEDVAIEHEDAAKLNDEIYAELNHYGEIANLQLGAERGECPDMEGTGKRFSHVFAIAPNASSSIICGGVSPSIEPILANAFTQKTLSGSHLVKNPALVPVLERYGRNDEETWTDIIVNRGSVQHLDFLTLWEKAVFKTAIEIDQMVLVDLAAQRTKYICQGQSLNLFMPADVSAQVLNKVHFAIWAKGLKSAYYLRSEAVKSTEVVSKKVERIQRAEAPAGNRIDPAAESDCLACEA